MNMFYNKSIFVIYKTLLKCNSQTMFIKIFRKKYLNVAIYLEFFLSIGPPINSVPIRARGLKI